MLCANCGADLKQSENFCGACGQKNTNKTRGATNEKPVEQKSDSTEGANGFIYLEIDTQPLVLPLEKFEFYIDGNIYSKTYKFGQKDVITLSTGRHVLHAVCKVPLIKRISNTLTVNITEGEAVELFVEYNNFTAGIKLIKKTGLHKSS